MDENCTHDCSTCGASCSSREQPQSLLEPMNPNSDVRNVIAVVSGKGGVGKSLVTALLACNGQADTSHADIFIFLPTGAEALNGSTRMKAGTATKMALNAITTGAMARAGKVYGNLMVDVKPTNKKLVRRAVRLICTISGADEKTASSLLPAAGGNVKTACVMFVKKCTRAQAEKLLKKHKGFLREALRER